MKVWHAIRRLVSVSWLVAAPLVVVVLILALGLLLWLVQLIVGLVLGPDAAEAAVYDFAMVFGFLFWLAVIGVPIYALVSLVRSRRRQK